MGELENLSREEVELVKAHREKAQRDRWINEGLDRAARLALSWAEEAGGGSGVGGEGFRNFAAAARQMMQPLQHDNTNSARCHGNSDGDCSWAACPQIKDGEPYRTGRHCPLDRRGDDT